MSVNLFFTEALDTSHPVDLLFATETLIYNGTRIRLSVSLAPPSMAFTASAKTIYRASFSIALPPPAMAFTAAYDNAVQRGLLASASAGWQQAAPERPQTAMAHRQADQVRAYRGAAWGAATALRRQTGARWQENTRRPRQTRQSWQEATRRPSATASTRWQERDRSKRPALSSLWQEATRVSAGTVRAGWQERGRHARPTFKAPWGEGTRVSVELKAGFTKGRPVEITLTVPWQEGRHAPPGRSTYPQPEPPAPHICYTPPPGSAVPLLFTDLWTGRTNLLFRCLDRPRPALVVVPIKRVYMVINDGGLRRVDGGELPVFSMSMSLDADSWTWNFSASLPASALADLQPNSSGDPVELEARINGTFFRVINEKISRSRTFGKESVSIGGRGKSALLDAPYAPVMTFGSGEERTAQQLLNEVLTVNGVSIGWEVDWNLTDWLVPAGVWAHQGTYISAANAIVGAAGGYVHPHSTDEQLIVLPRYPSAPWEWGSLFPDFELPSAVTVMEGIEWLDKAAYNRVFVSGAGVGGILGRVTRAGTAGDIVAPMVTDALITAAAAARQRGTAILSDTGRQAHVSLKLPVLEETGVIVPGKIVRYVDGSEERLGIVRSTAIDWSLPEAWQSIGVETHVA